MRAPKKKEKKKEFINRVLIDNDAIICSMCKHNTNNYKPETIDFEVLKFIGEQCRSCIYQLRKNVSKTNTGFLEQEEKFVKKRPWLANNFKMLYEWENEQEGAE